MSAERYFMGLIIS